MALHIFLLCPAGTQFMAVDFGVFKELFCWCKGKCTRFDLKCTESGKADLT